MIANRLVSSSYAHFTFSHHQPCRRAHTPGRRVLERNAVGEQHATSAKFEILRSFFDYFRSEFDATTYLSEKGVASAFLVDRYLRTGEERVLEALMSMISTSSAYSLEQAGGFRDLRATWTASGGSFRYVGVDVEHAVSAPVAAVSLIAEERGGDPPPVVAALCELADGYWDSRFPAWGHSDVPVIRSRVEQLHAAMQADHADARQLRANLRDHYDITLLTSIDGRSTGRTPLHRCSTDRADSSRARSFPPSSTTTIASTMMLAPVVVGESNDDAGTCLGRVTRISPAIIPLDRADSPFARELFLVGGGKAGTVTTDYIQVAILVSGSQAVTPYQR